MLTKSKYTIIQKIHDDEYLFYNSKNSILKLYNYDEYLNFQNGKFEGFEEFIIDDEIDEFNSVYTDKLKYINSKKDYIRFTIFPTMNCNARCNYCFENGDMRKDMSKETIDNTIKFIKSQVVNYKKLRVYWFGGEPFIRYDIMKYITRELFDFCQKNEISYKASVATNLSLINNDNYIDRLDELKIDKLEFAFDGVNDKHNSIKNYYNSNFDAFCHNLYMLPKILDKGIIVQLRLNCTISNFDELTSLLEYLMEKYGNYDNFIPYFAMIFPTKYYNKDDLIDVSTLSQYKLKIFEIMNKYNKQGMENFPLDRNITNCYGSNPNSLVIGYDGLITKCQGCSTKVEQSIGNVIDGITKNKVYDNWCYNNLIDDCKKCNIFPICLGGCTDSLLSNNKKPCIKEKYYLQDLLKYIANYMDENEIKEYRYKNEKQKNV